MLPDSAWAQTLKSDVSKVEVAFPSLMPGSQFINEAPDADEILHLAFEEASGATSFRDVADVSPAGRALTCYPGWCPSAGKAGQVGAAVYFDGDGNKTLPLPDDDEFDFGVGSDQSFAVMAWVNPDATQLGLFDWMHSIIEKGYDYFKPTNPYPFGIRYMYKTTADEDRGKVEVSRSNGTSTVSMVSTHRINDGRFHHIAFVKDSSTLTLYVDGVKDKQIADLTTGSTANASWLYIGRCEDTTYLPSTFAGLIDEVRIFKRAVSAAEIRAIYAGSGPVLALPFEEGADREGSTVADGSPWGHDGTMHTGTTDAANKAVAGEVGTYTLNLDGVDDYVSTPNATELEPTAAS